MLDLDGTFELLRGVPIPCWLLASVVLLSAHVGPVGAAHEFTAHRMQHFDLHGTQYGSRSALVNMEARGEDASLLNRKCVFVKWGDLSLDKFLDLIQRGAGAMVILLPADMQSVKEDVLKTWRDLEARLFELKVAIPIYFAIDDPELEEIHNNLVLSAKKEKTATAVEVLLSTLTDYGYQMMSEEQKETQSVKDPHFVTLVGKLTGQGLEHKLPTVVLLAHYDAMGLATTLSHGPDSNGSGVAAILELARLFSRLYSDPKMKPRYNLMFILSGGGNFNYFGTKALLDEQLDDPDSSLFPSADYTLCLDTLASQGSEELFLHLSKPLKEGMRAYDLVQSINTSAQALSPDLRFSVVHKKIRLSEDLLAWEHERFSLKRLPAATLSSLSSHKDHRRRTMFATRSSVSADVLTRNVEIIAEGLAGHIFNLTDYNISEKNELLFRDGSYSINKDFMWAWLEDLSSHALSPQLLREENPVVKDLEEALGRYTHDLTKSVHKLEKNEPDVVVYDLPKTQMKAYRMKPAVFDLFLAVGIAGYSFLWYFSVLFFPYILSHLSHLPFFIQVRTTKMD